MDRNIANLFARRPLSFRVLPQAGPVSSTASTRFMGCPMARCRSMGMISFAAASNPFFPTAFAFPSMIWLRSKEPCIRGRRQPSSLSRLGQRRKHAIR